MYQRQQLASSTPDLQCRTYYLNLGLIKRNEGICFFRLNKAVHYRADNDSLNRIQ